MLGRNEPPRGVGGAVGGFAGPLLALALSLVASTGQAGLSLRSCPPLSVVSHELTPGAPGVLVRVPNLDILQYDVVLESERDGVVAWTFEPWPEFDELALLRVSSPLEAGDYTLRFDDWGDDLFYSCLSAPVSRAWATLKVTGQAVTSGAQAGLEVSLVEVAREGCQGENETFRASWSVPDDVDETLLAYSFGLHSSTFEALDAASLGFTLFGLSSAKDRLAQFSFSRRCPGPTIDGVQLFLVDSVSGERLTLAPTPLPECGACAPGVANGEPTASGDGGVVDAPVSDASVDGVNQDGGRASLIDGGWGKVPMGVLVPMPSPLALGSDLGNPTGLADPAVAAALDAGTEGESPSKGAALDGGGDQPRSASAGGPADAGASPRLERETDSATRFDGPADAAPSASGPVARHKVLCGCSVGAGRNSGRDWSNLLAAVGLLIGIAKARRS